MNLPLKFSGIALSVVVLINELLLATQRRFTFSFARLPVRRSAEYRDSEHSHMYLIEEELEFLQGVAQRRYKHQKEKK